MLSIVILALGRCGLRPWCTRRRTTTATATAPSTHRRPTGGPEVCNDGADNDGDGHARLRRYRLLWRRRLPGLRQRQDTRKQRRSRCPTACPRRDVLRRLAVRRRRTPNCVHERVPRFVHLDARLRRLPRRRQAHRPDEAAQGLREHGALVAPRSPDRSSSRPTATCSISRPLVRPHDCRGGLSRRRERRRQRRDAGSGHGHGVLLDADRASRR